MTPTIFISIAAYREFDLVNTLRDCLAQAEDASRLRICICWQHAADESLAEFAADPRFDIIDVPYQESRGVCWARNAIQRRYGGETYFLQLDGHHRFVPGWDRKMIDMLEGLRRSGVAKPILTGYVPGYDPWNDPAGRCQDVWATGLDRFEPGGVVFMRPFVPPTRPTAPMPARFWSAHFSFSQGCFNEEVVVDPTAYFHSEEIVMGVRAWTHGYDLFNPHETLLWHEYSRKGRICHWNDHADWGTRNAKTIERYRRQFGVDGTARIVCEPYGFGSQRSLRDFERFAGMDFATRGVQPPVIENQFPPDPLQHAPEDEWRQQLVFSHCTDVYIERPRLEAGIADMWAVIASAADGSQLFREDYLRPRFEDIMRHQEGDWIQFFIAFYHRQQPHTWTVWPHSNARGWLGRIDGPWPQPAPTPPPDTP